MPGEVEERDLGWNQIKKQLAEMAKNPLAVDIGVLGQEAAEAHGNDGLNNVKLAQYHEFGGSNGNPPERSFLRSTMVKNSKKYINLVAKQSKKFYEAGVSPKDFLGLVGQRVAADVKLTIKKKIPPPLTEETMARKRKNSSTPLVDTSQLINSITYVVRKQSEGK
jgi:hypothetical protein